jgi:hypothetical protein
MSEKRTKLGRLIAGALAAALALSGCLVRYVTGPRLTGTCGGACDHYLGCRREPDPGHAIRRACLAECPGVLGDADSIMAFESLSCPDTIEFVEGPARRPPGAPVVPSAAAAE